MEHVEFLYQSILVDLNLLKENCVLRHLGFIKVCWPHAVTLLNHIPILEWYMARLVATLIMVNTVGNEISTLKTVGIIRVIL